MPWVRIDDSFADHPKVLQAGLPAIGLYILALSHSGRHLTDGHISQEFVRQKAGRHAGQLADTLVQAGLWELNGDGWDIHDYLDFNPSGSEVRARREEVSRVRAEAGRKGARARWQK
jgi:hypothetical protein